jgi:hypothetical protein
VQINIGNLTTAFQYSLTMTVTNNICLIYVLLTSSNACSKMVVMDKIHWPWRSELFSAAQSWKTFLNIRKQTLLFTRIIQQKFHIPRQNLGVQMPLQYYFCLRIYFFLVLSWIGANKTRKIFSKWLCAWWKDRKKN